jgi:phosphoribosylformylglycinamidine synthase subunit PurS
MQVASSTHEGPAMEQMEAQEQQAPSLVCFTVRVHVTLKSVVNDPQGLAARDALRHLGYAAVQAVRIGKVIDVELTAADAAAARAAVEEMARRLLANPVIEQFALEDPRPAPL